MKAVANWPHDRLPSVAMIVPDPNGGIYRYSTELAGALSEHVPLTMYTSYGHELSGKLDFRVEPIFLLGFRAPFDQLLPWRARRAIAVGRYLLSLARLAISLRRTPPAIIHVQGLLSTPHGLATLLACRLAGRPIVLTAHNALPRNQYRGWRMIYSMSAGTIDHLICHSRPARDLIAQAGLFKPDSISVIPHGEYRNLRAAKLPDRAAARARFGLPPEEVVALIFGYLRPYKGLKTMIQAMSYLVQSGEKLHLVVAGQAANGTDEYIEAALSAGVANRVTFISRFLDTDEMASIFVSSDLAVLPYEGGDIDQSGAGQVALAYELPLIVSTAGGLRDLIDGGKCGWVFEQRDASELASVLREALANRERLREMGQHGCQYARRAFGWEAIANQTLKVYSEVLDATSGGHL